MTGIPIADPILFSAESGLLCGGAATTVCVA